MFPTSIRELFWHSFGRKPKHPGKFRAFRASWSGISSTSAWQLPRSSELSCQAHQYQHMLLIQSDPPWQSNGQDPAFKSVVSQGLCCIPPHRIWCGPRTTACFPPKENKRKLGRGRHRPNEEQKECSQLPAVNHVILVVAMSLYACSLYQCVTPPKRSLWKGRMAMEVTSQCFAGQQGMTSLAREIR